MKRMWKNIITRMLLRHKTKNSPLNEVTFLKKCLDCKVNRGTFRIPLANSLKAITLSYLTVENIFSHVNKFYMMAVTQGELTKTYLISSTNITHL